MPFTMTADEIPKMLADPAFQALPHTRRTELSERAIAEAGQQVAQDWDQPTFQKWGKFTEKVRGTVAGMEGVGEKIGGAVSSTVSGVGHLVKGLAQDAGTVALAAGEVMHPSGWEQGLPTAKALGKGFAAGVDSMKASAKSALTTNEQADLDVKAGLETLKGEIDQGKVPMDDPAQFESWLTKHDTDLTGKRAKFFADADTILTRGLKVRDPNISETASAGANGLLHPDNAALLSSYMVTRSPETWKQLQQNLYQTPEMRNARKQGDDIREGPAGQAFIKAFGKDSEQHLTSATHPLMLAGFALPLLRGAKAATLASEATGLGPAAKAVGGQMLHTMPEMGAFGAVGQLEHDPQSSAGEIGTAAVQMAATGALLTGGIGAGGIAARGLKDLATRPQGQRGPAPEPATPRAVDADPMEASFRRAMGLPEVEVKAAQPVPAFRDNPLDTPAPVGSGNVIADYGIAKTPEAQAQFDTAELARQQQEAKLRGIEARAGSRMPVIPDSPLGGRDILDFVNDNPLHIPRKGSAAAGMAENNWSERYNVPLYYRKFLGSSERGHNATDLAQMAYDEHYIQEPTADALMAKIDEVIRARTSYKVEFRKREQAMEAEGKAVLNFEKDQAKGASQDKTLLALEDVNPGDEMTINGEQAKVRKIEYDDDGYLTNVVIEDGKRYGVLSLDPTTRAGVFVDEWAPKAREAVEPDPFSHPPEVVAAEKVKAQERAAVAALEMGAKEQPGGFKNLDTSGKTGGFLNTEILAEAKALVALGIRDFAEWSRTMITRFGEAIRDYLQGVWQAAGKTSEVGAAGDVTGRPRPKEPKAWATANTRFREPKPGDKINGLTIYSVDKTSTKNEAWIVTEEGNAFFYSPHSTTFRLTHGNADTLPRQRPELDHLRRDFRAEAEARPLPVHQEGPPLRSQVTYDAPRQKGVKAEDLKAGDWIDFNGREIQIQAATPSKGGIWLEHGNGNGSWVGNTSRFNRIKAPSEGFKNLAIEKDLEAGFMSTAGADALIDLAHSAVKAGKDAVAWLAEMVARFGEAVRGYAVDAWDAAHARLGRAPREWQFGGNKGTMPSANEAGFLRPALDELKVLKDKFKDVPKFTPFKAALNGWVGRSQTNVLAVSKLMTELERRVPDAVAREGITNYIQAAGDDTLLAAREAASKGRVRDGYKAARNLSPEALAEAARIRDFYDRALQHAQAEGLDVKELDNYVNQVWKKPALPQKRQAFAQFQTELSRSFQFAKHRKLESFFEGEQAGFEPATKDISKLMGLYLNELNKTISTRKMIAELTQGRASDGKPLAVPRGGAVMTQEGVPGEVTLVLPGAQGSVKFEGVKYDVRDYKRLDHSALAAWKFVTADSEGKPVMVLGELALHPEAIDTIRKALGRSKIREFMDSESENVFGHLARKGVKALDVVQSQIKAMMMSLSPFHIVQEGTHAIGHKVNPFFNIPTIDPGNPLHVDAMNHGLMLASERVGIDHFMDGLSGRGSWLEKVPGIGKAVRAMGDFTFHTYIPGLKMKTYDHILQRNTARFEPEVAAGKMTADDVKYLSAKQTNAAYGHLNYKDMGRDPTMQHLLRMILLAPDFLEARAKFTGQSIQGIGSKLGREQLAAMATLAITFFVSARIGNALANNGDMKMDHPFEFVIGNRVYSFRSVPEDIYRLMHRPQQFVAGRIAPVIGTGAMEGLYGVNYRGEKIDGMDAVQDVLTNAIPMSVRMLPGVRELVKAQKNHPVTPWEQFIGSIGVQIGRHSPITALQREAMKFAKASGVEDRGSYPISKYQQLRYALEDLNWDKAALEMQTLVKEKNGRKGELRDGFKSSLFRHWTGTREMDAAWKSTMKPEQKEMLLHAEERRQLVWQRFIKMLAQ